MGTTRSISRRRLLATGGTLALLTEPGKTWATARIPVFGPTGMWQFEGTYLRPWRDRLVNDDETQILIDSKEAQEALQYWVDLALTHKAIVSVAEAKTFDVNPFLTSPSSAGSTRSCR